MTPTPQRRRDDANEPYDRLGDIVDRLEKVTGELETLADVEENGDDGEQT